MSDDKPDACPSCGKPYALHLGLIGTCAKLRDAEAVAEAADLFYRDPLDEDAEKALHAAVTAWRKQRGRR